MNGGTDGRMNERTNESTNQSNTGNISAMVHAVQWENPNMVKASLGAGLHSPSIF